MMEKLRSPPDVTVIRRNLFAVTGIKLTTFNLLLVFVFLCTAVAGAKRSRQPRFDSSLRRPPVPGFSAAADSTSSRPIFRSTSQNVSVGPGDRAVLKCRVDNLGTKTITWRRRDEVHPLTIGLFPFVADSRIAVDFNQRTSEWSLIIQDVRPTDEGVYHCQISTKSSDNENSYDVKLNVKETMFESLPERPWSGVHVTGTEYVERGSAIQLVCNASGRPEPPYNVDWYKDGEKINSDADTGVIITKKIESRSLVSMLVMRSSRMADAGVYVCRSSNRDAGMINVIVLNVAATVEKRGAHMVRVCRSVYRFKTEGTSAEKIRSYDVAVVSAGCPPIGKRHLVSDVRLLDPVVMASLFVTTWLRLISRINFNEEMVSSFVFT